MKVPNLENPYKSYGNIPQGLAQVLSLMVHGRGKVIFYAQQGTMWWHGRWMGRKTWVWTLALPLFNHMAFYESPSLPESGFIDQEMRTITHIALVCSGCHKTGWCLKQQKPIFSPSGIWSPQLRRQQVWGGWAPWLAGGCLPVSSHSHPLACVVGELIHSSYNDTCPIRLGPTHMTALLFM